MHRFRDDAAVKKRHGYITCASGHDLDPPAGAFSLLVVGTGVCGLFQDKLQDLRTAIVLSCLDRRRRLCSPTGFLRIASHSRAGLGPNDAINADCKGNSGRTKEARAAPKSLHPL